jgi:hypothetical protein
VVQPDVTIATNGTFKITFAILCKIERLQHGRENLVPAPFKIVSTRDFGGWSLSELRLDCAPDITNRDEGRKRWPRWRTRRRG